MQRELCWEIREMVRDSRWRWGRGGMAECHTGCHASPSHNLGLLCARRRSLASPQSHGVRRDSGLENVPNVICSFDSPTPESSLKAQITRLAIRGAGKVRGREARLQQMQLPAGHSCTRVAKKQGGPLPRPKDDGQGLTSAPKRMPRPRSPQAGHSGRQQRD